MGLEIKLEKAKSKETMKENKKGMAHNSEYLCASKKSCHNRALEQACSITDGRYSPLLRQMFLVWALYHKQFFKC